MSGSFAPVCAGTHKCAHEFHCSAAVVHAEERDEVQRRRACQPVRIIAFHLQPRVDGHAALGEKLTSRGMCRRGVHRGERGGVHGTAAQASAANGCKVAVGGAVGGGEGVNDGIKVRGGA